MTQQTEHFVIKDLDQIKALADPLRQRILGLLVNQPRTTKQVAIELGEPLTKLYRHVEMLEQAGLITLVRTVPKRGATEKYFQAVARSFAVAGNSLSPEAATEVEEMFSKAFEEILSEVRAGVCRVGGDQPAGPGRAFLASCEVRVTPERLIELQERLAGLAQEFSCEDGETVAPFKLLIAMCPKS